VHVDIDPVELGRVYLPDVGLVADAQLAARALAEAAPTPEPDRAARRAERLTGLRARLEEVTSLDSGELAADDPGTGVSSISAVRARQGPADRNGVLLVGDAPASARGPTGTCGCRGRGASSVPPAGRWRPGLPAGMGLAPARPGERVVTVSGDGSFWMVAQDLETCVRENIGTVDVVMNNFAYGNTRDRQRSAHGGRYLGVFYGNPDFAAFARSLGGCGVRVERDEDLGPALEEALAQERPAIIDVVQDRMCGLPPGSPRRPPGDPGGRARGGPGRAHPGHGEGRPPR
jgi:acetolactate synthase-1/2/3 large subunit